MKHNDAIHSLELIFEWNGATDEEKLFWGERFVSSSQEAKEALLEFFASYPAEIKNFTNLQIKKEAVLKTKNDEAWKEFINEEEGYLDSLTDTGKSPTVY